MEEDARVSTCGNDCDEVLILIFTVLSHYWDLRLSVGSVALTLINWAVKVDTWAETSEFDLASAIKGLKSRGN